MANATDSGMQPIGDIAAQLGLSNDDILGYGKHKAKIPINVIYSKPRKAKLVLVTSINPTPFGEGKTTVSIGLSEALNKIGIKATAVLREPSLGPTLGMKGGATGGGKASVIPSTDINLHFTGDFHAITSAHNLLAALIDNALYFGTHSQLSATRISWKRVLDMNDRALRNVVIGLGGRGQGVPRETGFDITAASEVMAVLSLAKDRDDLITRLGRIVIGVTRDNKPITVGELGAAEPMAALLSDAIMPNLVQTVEHTPAIIHGGPFANIAHGCNSILATEAGLRFSDVVVTEAGFGADLGAEKFLDIKAPRANLHPDLSVVVVTLRALKYQGGQSVKDIEQLNIQALQRGFANLQKHIENLKKFGLPVVVAVNHFSQDHNEEIEWLQGQLQSEGIQSALVDVFSEGGAGGVEAARLVMKYLNAPPSHSYQPLYRRDMSITEKIEKIATEIYGANGVEYSSIAKTKLARYQDWGDGGLDVCIAKTQYSLSDDPKLLGRPTDFFLHIRDVEIARGAGYVVPLAGDMVRMPGLPKSPAAYNIRLNDQGQIEGI